MWFYEVCDIPTYHDEAKFTYCNLGKEYELVMDKWFSEIYMSWYVAVYCEDAYSFIVTFNVKWFSEVRV